MGCMRCSGSVRRYTYWRSVEAANGALDELAQIPGLHQFAYLGLLCRHWLLSNHLHRAKCFQPPNRIET